jgi:DNA-binding NtrC family response regulator
MNKNILIVDDDASIVEGLEEVFQEAGYNVKSALKGVDAIALAKTQHFHLIFIDLIMPDMDGIELCKAVKEISPDSVSILFTGNLDAELIYKEVEFIDAGGKVYYLYKPLFKDELLSAARKAIEENNL